MTQDIDYARIFRAAMNMEPGKARHFLSQIAAAATTNGAPKKDMRHLTDKTHAQYYAKAKKDVNHLHGEIAAELRIAEGEVLRKLRRHFAHASIESAEGDDFMFDAQALASDLGDVLKSSLPEILISAGQDVFDAMGKEQAFDPPPAEAKAFITERENLMTNVAQETFDSVKTELQDGLDKGESYREIAKRLNAKFDEINTGRADVVAHTEVSSAYGFARHKAMIDAGALYKVWRGSGRPPGTLHGMRPAHAAAHYAEQTVPIDKPFRIGGQRLMYPTDSSLGAGPEQTINCFCVALPAEKP
jgi:hypothetical protein